jgi:hypothetical protein
MLWSRVERHECFDGWDKVIGYSAADAPICQLNDVLGRAIGDRPAFQDLAVDADIAKLVDDDGEALALGGCDLVAELGGFA